MRYRSWVCLGMAFALMGCRAGDAANDQATSGSITTSTVDASASNSQSTTATSTGVAGGSVGGMSSQSTITTTTGSGGSSGVGSGGTGTDSGGSIGSSNGGSAGVDPGVNQVPELTPEEIEAALAMPKQEFRFHHVHLNAQSPAASVEFYVTHFAATDLGWAGTSKAARSGRHWLVFDASGTPAAWELSSALFHMGFGVNNVQNDYDMLVSAGVEGETLPFNVSSRLCTGGGGAPNAAFLYGPDREVFEINAAASPDLRHLHFLSSDPNATGQWYVEHLGVTSSTPNPSAMVNFCNDIQISPSYGGNVDGIQMLWYPVEFAHGYYPELWANRTTLDPQRGRVVDHLALSVDDLDRAVTRLRAEGVEVTQFPSTTADGMLRSAFVMGPDGIELEVVEGHVP